MSNLSLSGNSFYWYEIIKHLKIELLCLAGQLISSENFLVTQ